MKLLITMKLLPTTIINIIREFYINLFLTNHLVNYQVFFTNISYFKKPLIQRLKYGLLIRTVNSY